MTPVGYVQCVEHWTEYLAQALLAAFYEAREHDVTLDRARRRIAHRVEREQWRDHERGPTSTAKPSNRHARRRDAAERRQA